MTAATVDRVGTLLAGFVRRAQIAGHPVCAAYRGRYISTGPCPVLDPARPNDLLELVREEAYDQVPWVHLLMRGDPAAGRLAAAVAPIGDPVVVGTGRPQIRQWDLLVCECPIGPITCGRIVNLPVSMLDRSLRGVA